MDFFFHKVPVCRRYQEDDKGKGTDPICFSYLMGRQPGTLDNMASVYLA